jgi:hypothetical protein
VGNPLRSFRCRLIALEPDPRGRESGTFFRCPACGAAYNWKGSGPLVDRWLMPVTLPLYRAIDVADPESRITALVREMSVVIGARSHAARQRFIEDIEAELASPRQPLAQVLPDCYANVPGREAVLRRFLRRFAKNTCALNDRDPKARLRILETRLRTARTRSCRCTLPSASTV